MISFKEVQKLYGNFATYGQQLKDDSDKMMELTWDNDIQSKVCYIYDYFHDDQPDLKDHMTYNHTIKTKIDAKFIIKEYQSIDKDQIAYYIQFKPSQKMYFDEHDDLYYFYKEYVKRYGLEFPVGAFIDIPDDAKVYRKWLIAGKEYANQFPKYLIVPINYKLQWIEKNGQHRTKREMWGSLRTQSSYNSGVYTDYRFTRMENQEKCWVPLNPITEKLWYTDDVSKNMRMVISAPTEHPLTWSITKIENTQPVGIQKITFYQNAFDEKRDYVERDENGYITGMWADMFAYNDGTYEKDLDDAVEDNKLKPNIECKIITSSNVLKIGGTYHLFTAKLFDGTEDITCNYSSATYEWAVYINDENSEEITDIIKWLPQDSPNCVKLKMPLIREYSGKSVKISCIISDENSKISYGNISMELSI